MSIGKRIQRNREAMQPWLPFVFCISVAIMVPLVSLLTSSTSSDWLPVFPGFLAMCLFFVGSAMWQMRKEIAALRQRVASLEASGGAAQGASPLDAESGGSTPPQFSLKLLLAVVVVLAIQFAIIAKFLDASRAPAIAPPAPRIRLAPPAPRIGPMPPVPAPRAPALPAQIDGNAGHADEKK